MNELNRQVESAKTIRLRLWGASQQAPSGILSIQRERRREALTHHVRERVLLAKTVQLALRAFVKLPPPPPPPVTLAGLLSAMAKKHGVTVSEIMGEGRGKHVVPARFEFCYLAYKTGKWSYQQIGRAIGGRDHTTIRNATLKHIARNGLDRSG